MSRFFNHLGGSAWLTGLLTAALLLLVLQTSPTVARAVDYRDWSRTTWLAVNAGVLVVLATVRFLPDLLLYHRQRRRPPLQSMVPPPPPTQETSSIVE